MTIDCFAKVNLFLEITGRRPDGFHDLKSVFQTVSLADTVTWTTADRFSLKVELDFPCDPGVEAVALERENLIEKIWRRLHAEHGVPPLAVRLIKRIPIGAGLGGGSSDGAGFLAAANEAFALGRTPEQLRFLASEFGSDLPFFIEGGAARVTGRGEFVENFSVPATDATLVLIWPGVPISTPLAYRELVEKGAGGGYPEFLRILAAGGLADLTHLGSLARNGFQKRVLERFPAVRRALDLLAAETPFALLSGSGSTVFGVFPGSDAAVAAAEKARREFPGSWIVRPTDRGHDKNPNIG